MIKLHVGNHNFEEKHHIYQNISEALLSWKACKGLGILPDYYLQPITR